MIANVQVMTHSELAALIASLEQNGVGDLFEQADTLRRSIYKDAVYFRGLIEFSNCCKNNCYYCGIRRDNETIRRYRLTKQEILDCCKTGYGLGFRTFVLQGGEDPYFGVDVFCDILCAIKGRFPDCAITLSFGEQTRETFKAYKNAGVDRYLLRHETADADHYSTLHPAEMCLESRQSCLFTLRELGFQVGAGFMVGSPGQTYAHLARDLLFLKDLQPHMVGIGPFLPHHETPLAKHKQGSLELTLIMIALTRMMLPTALIPSTTALGTIHPTGRERGLKAGANVVMPNLSPVSVRKEYTLYDNKISTGEEAAEGLATLRKTVENAGYSLASCRGDSIRMSGLCQ